MSAESGATSGSQLGSTARATRRALLREPWAWVHGALWALLWLLMLRFPLAAAADGLDPAWRALLGHDWLTGATFGVDTVFTYGPLGYFGANDVVYVKQLFGARVLVDLAVKALAVAAALFMGRRLTRGWLRLLYQLALVSMAPVLQDAAPLLTILALTIHIADPARVGATDDTETGGGPGWWPVLGVLGVFALASLVKFTFLLLTIPCALALAATFGARRGAGRGLGVLAAYAACLAAAWSLVAGQPLHEFPEYIAFSREISVGYNQSRGLVGDRGSLLLGVASLALVGAALTFQLALARRPGRLMALIAGGGLALAWKAGFVRQDAGHTLMFFPVALFAGLVSATHVCHRLPVALRKIGRGLAILGMLTALVGSARAASLLGYSLDRVRPMLELTAFRNLNALLRPGDAQAFREAERERLARQFALPRIVEHVGSGTVDLIAHEQGVLFLNDLNVHHRPVFQSYSAYTPELCHLNGRFYSGPDAPDFLLYKLQPTARLYPTIEDSTALLAMLRHYQPVLTEKGYLLLERWPAPLAAASGEVLRQSLRFGAWMEPRTPAGAPLLLRLAIPISLRGRLIGIGLRLPSLWLETRDSNGQERRARISPSLAATDFLLSPALGSTFDVLQLLAGQPLPDVVALRVVSDEPQAFGPVIDLELTVGPELLPPDRAPVSQDFLDRSRAEQFPMVQLDSGLLAEVRGGRREASRIVEGQTLFVPGRSRVTLRLPAGDHRIELRYGMRPDAYQPPARSDGMSFVARMLLSGSPPRELFRRHLDPATQADRGVQTRQLELELAAPAVVELLTEPGPAGSGAWDRGEWLLILVEAR